MTPRLLPRTQRPHALPTGPACARPRPPHARRRSWLRSLALVLACCTLAGCELVANFDRGRIPAAPPDAAVHDAGNGGSSQPPDAGSPGAGNDAGSDEDAGQ